MSTKAQSNFIQSVERAMQILELFSENNREQGVTEIANLLGLYKSTAFGIIATLEEHQFIQQNLENGKYSLGMKILKLGNVMQNNLDIRNIANPCLKKLVEKYHETVHLGILNKGDIVYIDKISGPSAVQIMSGIGHSNPAYATGIGKCIMAYLDERKLVNALPKEFKKFTDNTITSIEELMAELKEIRSHGYAIDNQEIEIGLVCIAAPIKDVNGEIIAAISLSGPSMRMEKDRIEEMIPFVKETALKISERLGFINR